MININQTDNYTAESQYYEESVAEALSLELQRDSRRYSADFEN